ncbi:MAG: 30S ribosomal protein S30e [Thaumarchaeota archaeon]|nr:30S ribosomal protein S30e [Nitrososphaerota archaeon]MDE1867705.1 30S ribosomal protein S30e [Nitrososphaerota archaeon]
MPTHGSLTKAGKVRGQTPKVPARERHGEIGSARNRDNFRKRFILKRVPGQNKPGQRRRK